MQSKLFYWSIFLISPIFLNAQNESIKTDTLWVNGNCGMCKTTIEIAANIPAVEKAIWDRENKLLYLTYDSSLISSSYVLMLVAQSGYDNEEYLARQEIYDELPACCHYDRSLNKNNYKDAPSSENEMDHSQMNHTDMGNDSDNEGDGDNELKIGIVDLNLKEDAEIDRNRADLTENINSGELLKAACCNLSESFETNATVDVSTNNAVTGTKQLKMLGLNQKYTLLTKELLPDIRGLANAYGLNFIPGRWISGIQLTKGGSTVVNGYESMTGQINTEMVKWNRKDETKLNLFADSNSRVEGNLSLTDKINEKWSQSVLFHANGTIERQDQNDDGFIDQPVGNQINTAYILKYDNLKNGGWASLSGFNFLTDRRTSGQMNFHDFQDNINQTQYGVNVNIQRLQFWNKTGFIFEGRPYQSLGITNQFTYHNQDSYFGLRDYEGIERTWNFNAIFESIFGNTNHKYKAGLSFLLDDFSERYNHQPLERTEQVPGAFFEYTFTQPKWTIVAGIRSDFHNLVGTQFTPRLNVKYDAAKKTTLRFSAGRGFRTANVLADAQQFFPSQRTIDFANLPREEDLLEASWNTGLSLQQEMKLFNRKSTVLIDYFYTYFTDQVVVDLDQSAQQIAFYPLQGESSAHAFQVQWDMEPFRRFNIRWAYKFYEVQTDYILGEREAPFTPNHRGFVNLSYETMKMNDKFWSFDTTIQWVGSQRIPDTATNPLAYQVTNESDDYFLWNAQIAWNSKNWRVYVGKENILNYIQDNPIVQAENPFGNYFDAGMVWAPIMRGMFYVGIDWEL